jgi:hypothetical protein
MNITLINLKNDEEHIECSSFEIADGFIKLNRETETLYISAGHIKSFVVDQKIPKKPMPTKKSSAVLQAEKEV